MDQVIDWQTDLNDVEQTSELAHQIGEKLNGGEILQLVGDMGSGKTTFVKALAAGAGSKDHVSSPSFTISNQYKTKDLTIYHFDFHRLNEPGIMRSELAEIIKDDNAVVVIEWADIVEDVLPEDHLTIKFTPLSESSRRLQFSGVGKTTRLIPRT
jgi:tRNA threonylcarbamoyladenosine biosynthesis protein TsaE